MSLEADLLKFDGRATTILTEARARHQFSQTYLDDLIAFVADQRDHLSVGATWLLKADLESGSVLSAQQITNVCTALPTITAWQAALHVLQSVEHLHLTADAAARIAQWSAHYLDHKRPFLRAWSLSAVVTLARVYPNVGLNVLGMLERARNDPAASVRARARQLAQG